MRIEYESSVEEVAESSLERYREAPSIRRIELGFGAATALLLGAATATRVGGAAGIAAGLASAVLGLLVYRRAAHWLQRRLIRRTWREYLGGGPLGVSVDVGEDGIAIRYGAHETLTRWADVRPPLETGGGVKLRDAEGTLLEIPARAFAGSTAAAEFRQRVEAGAGR